MPHNHILLLARKRQQFLSLPTSSIRIEITKWQYIALFIALTGNENCVENAESGKENIEKKTRKQCLTRLISSLHEGEVKIKWMKWQVYYLHICRKKRKKQQSQQKSVIYPNGSWRKTLLVYLFCCFPFSMPIYCKWKAGKRWVSTLYRMRVQSLSKVSRPSATRVGCVSSNKAPRSDVRNPSVSRQRALS